MSWPFVPGLRLSEALYREGIVPVLAAEFPGLRYGVARLDSGSDVLGFDTPTSMDHGWGPRATVFLSEPDYQRHAGTLSTSLARGLPVEVLGVPTNFESPRLVDGGLKPVRHGPVQHGIAITTVDRFFREYVGFEASSEVTLLDWLTAPSQRLRTIASGRVFADLDGEIERRRRTLRWYPEDPWRYVMASQWRRIGQDEALMARAAQVGDELGSRQITARLVMELIRLTFLQERQHVPYVKWVGSAFRRLPAADALAPLLEAALDADDWTTRERLLGQGYELAATRHNELELTEPLETRTRPFYERQYEVVAAERFGVALEAGIEGEAVRALPTGLGAVWQFADSADVLEDLALCRRLGAVYGPLARDITG